MATVLQLSFAAIMPATTRKPPNPQLLSSAFWTKGLAPSSTGCHASAEVWPTCRTRALDLGRTRKATRDEEESKHAEVFLMFFGLPQHVGITPNFDTRYTWPDPSRDELKHLIW